jgi:hypothetical protein
MKELDASTAPLAACLYGTFASDLLHLDFYRLPVLSGFGVIVGIERYDLYHHLAVFVENDIIASDFWAEFASLYIAYPCAGFSTASIVIGERTWQTVSCCDDAASHFGPMYY